MQYNLDIYNYFKFGSIHSTASSEVANYGQEHIKPLKYAFNMNVRTYSELHNLALQMNKKEFVDQLKLNEIPLDIFKTVNSRFKHQKKGVADSYSLKPFTPAIQYFKQYPDAKQ